VQAVTTYVARRLVERERALDEDPGLIARAPAQETKRYRSRRRCARSAGSRLDFSAVSRR
jgi:hypothetical protein